MPQPELRTHGFFSQRPGSTEQTTAPTPAPDAHASAYDRLRLLAIFSTVVHAGSCVAMIVGVSVRMQGGAPQFGVARVGRVASCWGGFEEDSTSLLKDIAYRSITNELSTSRGLDRHVTIAVLLVTFFFLSAVFQALFLASSDHRQSILLNRPQWFRFSEYALSAGCMIVAIFIAFGMLDMYLHATAFVLTLLCMLTGLAADFSRDLSLSADAGEALKRRLRGLALALHYLAWIPMMVVWAVLWAVVVDMANGQDVCRQPNGNALPAWVWAVLVVQFLLFVSFGYVQLLQFSRQFDIDIVRRFVRTGPHETFLALNPSYDPAAVGILTEQGFLCLSLVAKSVLGWIVYSEVLVFL